jgi:archaemetzincin
MHNRLHKPAVGATAALAFLMAAALVPSGPFEADARRQTLTPTPAASRILYIQPLGRALSTKAVNEVKVAFREFYGFTVKLLPRKPLPKWAYYRPRRRYRAEKLLRYLKQIAPRDTFRIMGLTAVDISTTKGRFKDWGIMGLATLDGKACVISMYRCKRGSRNKAHARHRLAKVAVHEVGHTLGLDHCPNWGCLMEDARGTNKTTDREYLICQRCRRLLTGRGYVLPPNPKPPWPKPKVRRRRRRRRRRSPP